MSSVNKMVSVSIESIKKLLENYVSNCYSDTRGVTPVEIDEWLDEDGDNVYEAKYIITEEQKEGKILFNCRVVAYCSNSTKVTEEMASETEFVLATLEEGSLVVNEREIERSIFITFTNTALFLKGVSNADE